MGSGEMGGEINNPPIGTDKPVLNNETEVNNTNESSTTSQEGTSQTSSNAGKTDIANRFHHIFDKPEHNLGGLVEKYGSQENAFNAVQNAANQALKEGKLTPDSKGILPSGDAGNIINVGGMNVRLIGDRVQDSQVIISSFSRKGF